MNASTVCWFVSMALLPAAMELRAEEAKGESTHLQLIDDATGKPLAAARLILARTDQLTLPPDPLSAPPSAEPAILKSSATVGGRSLAVPPSGEPANALRQDVVCDAAGSALIPPHAPGATLTVLHDKGVAWLTSKEWSTEKPVLRVKLQAWARLEGQLLRKGRPLAGAQLSADRGMNMVFVGNMMSLYTPPLQHTASATTGASGRFVIERLLPTSIDGGHEGPYSIKQTVTAEDHVEPLAVGTGPLPQVSTPGFSYSITLASVRLDPGQHAKVEIEGLVRCVTEVSGRLVWAGGEPMQPARDWPADKKTPDHDLSFMPRVTSGSIWGLGASPKIGDDGRFQAKLPLSGPWRMSFRPAPAGWKFAGGAHDYDFTVPPPAGGGERGAPMDLGDIVLQRPGQVSKQAPVEAAKGVVEITFRVVGADHQPLQGVKASIGALESKTRTGFRVHHPKGLADATQDAAGFLHLRVPKTYRSPKDDDEDAGKLWTIDQVGAELEREGYKRQSVVLLLNETGATFAMTPVSAVAVWVTLEGRPLARKQVQIEAGWNSPARPFDFPKWEEEDQVLRHHSVPPGNWQIQAGHLDADGWRWFSEVRTVEAKADAQAAVELPLRRGLTLRGRIDGAVPRPVRAGMVRVTVLMPAPDPPNERPLSHLYWSDWQKLDEDGRFFFMGLPPGQGYIAASCEGWISSNGDTASPQVITKPRQEAISMQWDAQPLALKSETLNLAVPMTRTGSCVLCFKNADGTPLANVRPWWDPKLHLGEDLDESLASTNRELDDLLREPERSYYRAGSFLPNLASSTDAAGELHVLNLPPGKARMALSVGRDYVHPLPDGGTVSTHPNDTFAPFQVQILPGQTVRAEFIVDTSPKKK